MFSSIDPEPLMYTLLGMGFTIVVFAFVMWCNRATRESEVRDARIKLHVARAEKQRELIAFVSEGSISPADAERLIRAMDASVADSDRVLDELARGGAAPGAPAAQGAAPATRSALAAS